MQKQNHHIKLDKPGAGLPWLEQAVVKYLLFPHYMRQFDWQQSLEMMRNEKEKIISLTKDLSAEAFNKKVLIKRLPGLEDSSRYWSCGMAVKHVEIVKKGLSSIAESLARDEPPPLKADLVAVKPFDTSYDKEKTLREFDRALEDIFTKMQSLGSSAKNTRKAYHPFFGDIPCYGWVWLLGFHTRLHRKQIELILKGERHA